MIECLLNLVLYNLLKGTKRLAIIEPVHTGCDLAFKKSKMQTKQIAKKAKWIFFFFKLKVLKTAPVFVTHCVLKKTAITVRW